MYLFLFYFFFLGGGGGGLGFRVSGLGLFRASSRGYAKEPWVVRKLFLQVRSFYVAMVGLPDGFDGRC